MGGSFLVHIIPGPLHTIRTEVDNHQRHCYIFVACFMIKLLKHFYSRVYSSQHNMICFRKIHLKL